jgi:methylated-DNA-protein-cysteine methyltransferase-like protein
VVLAFFGRGILFYFMRRRKVCTTFRRELRCTATVSCRIENVGRAEDDLRKLKRRLMKLPPNEQRDAAIRKVVRQIPKGRVATYAQVAAAAGYPLHHRQVVQVLRKSGDSLPWQRVVGAGGYIRLPLDAGHEQRTRLELEGVRFRGRRIVMEEHQHTFRTWEFD